MKTPQEWMKQTTPPLYGSAIDRWIEAIQKDAFESGVQSERVSPEGLQYRVQRAFDEGYRKGLTAQPKDTCSKKGEM